MQKLPDSLPENFFYREEEISFSPWVEEMLKLLADSDFVSWKSGYTTSSFKYRANTHRIITQGNLTPTTNEPGTVSSIIAPLFISLVKDLCEKHNLEFKYFIKLFAAATSHVPGEPHGDIHKDNSKALWPYYHFILYLNDFSEGYTYLFDEDKNLLKVIVPKKFKAVLFENCFHAQGHCGLYDNRVAIVGTFIADKK